MTLSRSSVEEVVERMVVEGRLRRIELPDGTVLISGPGDWRDG
jgi:hypothetical protein